MSGLHWRVALATATFIALAMTAAWAQEQVKQEQDPCSKACYELMDKCTEACSNEVENNLCQQECFDKKDDCIKKCG